MNKNIKRRTLSESSKNAKLRRIQALLESLINESSESNTDDLDESLDRATSLQNHLMQQLQKPGVVLEGEMICGRDERPYTVMFFMRDEGLACYEEWSGEVSLLDSLIDFYKDYDYTEDELLKILRKMELTSAKEATSWFLPEDYLTREPY